MHKVKKWLITIITILTTRVSICLILTWPIYLYTLVLAWTGKREMEEQQNVETGGSKKLLCQYCKKYFMSPSKFEIHIIKTRPQEKSFRCETFLRKFSQGSNLRTHTGEKSFSCETCSQKFSRAGNLRRTLGRSLSYVKLVWTNLVELVIWEHINWHTLGINISHVKLVLRNLVDLVI